MKRDFILQLKDAVSILKLDESKMLEVSQRKAATMWGLFIFVIPSIVNLVLASQSFPSGFGVLFSRFLIWPIFLPLFTMVGTIFLVSFLSEKMFKGVKNHIGFFRTVSYSSLILWISVIPFILAIFGIIDPIGLYNLLWLVTFVWMFIVIYKMLLIYHKLNQQDAIVVMIIGVVGYLVIRGILGGILVGKSYRLWY